MKVGDLVKRFDWLGVVIRRHGFGRLTVLWNCGTMQDVHESNVQIEVISESR